MDAAAQLLAVATVALVALHVGLYALSAARDALMCTGAGKRLFSFRLGDPADPSVPRPPLALITGGVMGIGREVAVRCAALGYDVAVWDVAAESDAGRQTLRELQAIRGHTRGALVAVTRVDVADRASVAAAAAELLSQGRCPDLLVLNAGTVNGGLLVDGDDERGTVASAVARLIGVNVAHLYYVTLAFIRAMRGDPPASGAPWRRRSVVVLGSVAGFVGTAFMTDYNASKAAANVFAEALSAELRYVQRARGDRVPVDVTLVCPYLTTTGMFDGTRAIAWIPPLSAAYVAAAVMRGVRRRKRVVVLPHIMLLWLAAKALLPWGLLSWVDDVVGGSAAMASFRGRAPPARPSAPLDT